MRWRQRRHAKGGGSWSAVGKGGEERGRDGKDSQFVLMCTSWVGATVRAGLLCLPRAMQLLVVPRLAFVHAERQGYAWREARPPWG